MTKEKEREEITEEEWNEYNWIRVPFASPPQFIRGARYTKPPDDGYHYVEVTTFADAEQKWIRAVKVEENTVGNGEAGGYIFPNESIRDDFIKVIKTVI